jgi:hypothetical protein
MEIEFARENAERGMFGAQALDFDQQERFDFREMVIVAETQQEAETGEQQ